LLLKLEMHLTLCREGEQEKSIVAPCAFDAKMGCL
jgi:hypothetical protein